MGFLHNFYLAQPARVAARFYRGMDALGAMPPPAIVQWQATDRCELACRHCYGMTGTNVADELTTDEAQRLVVDELVRMGVEVFLVSGGEPLARPDLFEVLAYAATKGLPYTLNTNGWAVRERAEDLRRLPPDFVAVSLDGLEATHDDFRGRAGAFARALDAISFFKEIGVPTVVAGTTLTRAGVEELEEIFDIVASSPADRWGLHLIIPEGRAAERPELFPTAEQLGYVLEFVVRQREFYPVELADEMGCVGPYELLVRDSPFFCGAGRTVANVLPDGSVMPCVTADRRAAQGNVRRRPLAEIWRQEFREFRKVAPAGGGEGGEGCTTCPDSRSCGSGCWLQRRNGKQCFRSVWQRQLAPAEAVGAAGKEVARV